ncbi:PREDICTED: verrucotoxin subunit beta-like [Gekko japonicus]|uniref:Verrucotoxin subunit beta-like n=1 Tax=Gekko japonicus TaxID=146911 RepID=A0ABM1L8I2_GEKJA|nr:PREDICTED: verrucotoxin subunit beta-like [Gekko japonicus]
MAKMETLALQREVQLGMLYDCCKDALLPGSPLWIENTLGKNIHLQPNPSTESSIIESDTLQDKMAALKVPEWPKASLLCGLLEPRGAAQYLQDSESSRRQAHVALLYSVTTKRKQIDVTKLPDLEDCFSF